MLQFFTKSLMRRLTTQFMVVAVVPIAIVSAVVFYYSKTELERNAFDHLTSVSAIKKNQIIKYFKERIGDLTILSQSPAIREAHKMLQSYHDAGGGDPNGPYNVASKEYREIYEKIDPYLREYQDIYGYYDLFLICKNHGHVMYTVTQEQDMGTNLKGGPYRDSGLAKVWAKAINARKGVMVDFTHYAPSGEPAVFIGTPVFDQKGDVYAVLALQISTKHINDFMQQTTGMGETGESYFVGEDFLMRSGSRFEKDLSILKKKVDTVAVRKALKEQAGIEKIKGYRGVSVLSAYSHLGLNEELGTDFEWAIISEIDEAEAFASVTALGFHIIWLGLIVIALAGTVGYFAARSMATPLKGLSANFALIAEGDISADIKSLNRTDEIGILGDAAKQMIAEIKKKSEQFNQIAEGNLSTDVTVSSEKDQMGLAIQKMITNLKMMVSELIEGTNSISSSVSQLSTTISELSSSTAETATSINEVTTTVEEVRQAAQISSEKSGQVSDLAEASARNSEEGVKATNESTAGMQQIKEEMDYVAESIMKLSEQTQSIGDIINAVNDLADQSNLLSVNASIEAAKAGEQGKGFGVVAQEVKSLADQSKEATEQVRNILSDIQKATSSAVMATERGSKAVGSGERLAVSAGDVIRSLSDNVAESADSAVQIATSSQQQLTGIDQLATAMESIKDASAQNTEGAKQLEQATRGMEALGGKLKEITERFRI